MTSLSKLARSTVLATSVALASGCASMGQQKDGIDAQGMLTKEAATQAVQKQMGDISEAFNELRGPKNPHQIDKIQKQLTSPETVQGLVQEMARETSGHGNKGQVSVNAAESVTKQLVQGLSEQSGMKLTGDAATIKDDIAEVRNPTKVPSVQVPKNILRFKDNVPQPLKEAVKDQIQQIECTPEGKQMMDRLRETHSDVVVSTDGGTNISTSQGTDGKLLSSMSIDPNDLSQGRYAPEGKGEATEKMSLAEALKHELSHAADPENIRLGQTETRLRAAESNSEDVSQERAAHDAEEKSLYEKAVKHGYDAKSEAYAISQTNEGLRKYTGDAARDPQNYSEADTVAKSDTKVEMLGGVCNAVQENDPSKATRTEISVKELLKGNNPAQGLKDSGVTSKSNADQVPSSPPAISTKGQSTSPAPSR